MKRSIINLVFSVILGVTFVLSSTSCDEMQANEISRLLRVNQALTVELDSTKEKLAKIDSIQAAMFEYANSIINEQKATIADLTTENTNLNGSISTLTAQLATNVELLRISDSTVAAQSLTIVGLNGQISNLMEENLRLTEDLDGLLTQINNDIIANIDSIYVRIKRNYDQLILQ
jgi:uncharacterized coiled-coil protein SlyX